VDSQRNADASFNSQAPNFCIVTEFVENGSLEDLLARTQSNLSWRRYLHIAIGIASGLSWLHHKVSIRASM